MHVACIGLVARRGALRAVAARHPIHRLVMQTMVITFDAASPMVQA
jgi:hypothetical protein